MKPKLMLAAIIAIVMLALGGVLFIHFTNDHAECETVTEHTITSEGEKITTTRHICHERFAI